MSSQDSIVGSSFANRGEGAVLLSVFGQWYVCASYVVCSRAKAVALRAAQVRRETLVVVLDAGRGVLLA